MSIVKYPNGTIRELTTTSSVKKRNYTKAKLGVNFEQAINESNEYYLSKNIAAIYKKPTPIQIVKVDYPARNKAKITEAYYKLPSTTDYNGIYKEKYIDFEAKSCKELNFSFERIYPHQIKHLEKIEELGGISFLIIEFSSLSEVYILETKHLVEQYEESLKGGRKSISYDYIKTNGCMVNQGLNPKIDFLKAVDKVFFNK